jgi:hypothetical protein
LIGSTKLPDWGAYAPWVRYPDLFLRFARLVDDKGVDKDDLQSEANAVLVKWWPGRYGVLGLTPVTHHGQRGVRTCGGLGDTIKAFIHESLLEATLFSSDLESFYRLLKGWLVNLP